MSQYPHPFGYGQYYGQPVQQPYSYQNYSSYAAPAPNAALNPAAAQIYREFSQAAYNSNASNIPGLGVGGLPATGGTHHSLTPGATPWAQPPSFTASGSSVPPPQTYGIGSFGPQHSQPGLLSNSSRINEKPSSQPAPAPIVSAADTEVEEGELSEGQFEDLYEPRESVPVEHVEGVSVPPLIIEPSQPTSAADTPEGNFYATDEDDGGKDSNAHEGRERSASYSPFLSPREIESEIPTPPPAADKESHPGPTRAEVKVPNTAVPGLQHATHPPTSTGSTQPPMPTSCTPKASSGSFKSVQEAKKEAQKAILRLWPLGVKYQNYIDEGFDENLIKGLFRDLHLDMPKTVAESTSAHPKEPRPHEAGKPGSSKPNGSSDIQPQPLAPGPKELPSPLLNQPGKGEERKDRIARLLAAKAAKAPAVPKPPAPAVTQTNLKVTEARSQETAPAPSNSPPKGKTWGEKERLIQQKIAALQKSREAQAQKSATDIADQEAMQVGRNGTAAPQAKTTGSPTPISIPTGPKAAGVSVVAASVPPNLSQALHPIQNQVLSPNAQANPSAQRKRPVAADFVEYSSRPLSLKRPFGQVRKETSLIIDVSDQSDDEEMDMDMDMGSPIDEPSSSTQSSGVSGQRGPAIRDFPPLTDTFPQRHYSSPAPSVTPPGGLVNNSKKRETELDLKEKAIQEMRRKIALAEARRKAKQSSGGSVTPKQSGTASGPKENDTPRPPETGRAESLSSTDRLDVASPQVTPEPSSVRLPKSSETPRLDPLERAERRGRIMSLEIPRIESSLQEKLNRLQQLEEEQARLKAEIDRSFDEKKKLADELQQLDTTQVESSQPNGLGSRNNLTTEELGAERQATPSGPETEGGLAHIRTGSSSPARSAADGSRGTSAGSTDGGRLSHKYSQGEPSSTADSVVEEVTTEAVSVRAPTGIGPSVNDSPELRTNIETSSAKVDGNSQGSPTEGSALSPGSNQPIENDVAAPSMPEPAEVTKLDETTPMELDSRSPSPGIVEAAGSADVEDETTGADASQPSAPLPDQISSAGQPREAVQEIEMEVTGEVNAHNELPSNPNSTLTPYESPLRYFHAYRFHPEYQRVVAGGLKSLTYTNRIDPDKELCPFELNGEQCPPNCEFQHFGAISLADDEILLELGNPDGYSGKEKSRFIQGMRELVQKFKAGKVKDFETIAREIVEVRSQLLGDKSKVLRLDGVTI
ncbi:protein red1 [Achaetomium macrosporum]|uniref:Protein red1 n=1 Tax=Achaetomium macrosporum TaxID=79813 RepID=A0AAN7CCW8_9PEZI|nr:protein red1 [Achaetomium macrosporum]